MRGIEDGSKNYTLKDENGDDNVSDILVTGGRSDGFSF